MKLILTNNIHRLKFFKIFLLLHFYFFYSISFGATSPKTLFPDFWFFKIKIFFIDKIKAILLGEKGNSIKVNLVMDFLPPVFFF